jgi:hypothetical protein
MVQRTPLAITLLICTANLVGCGDFRRAADDAGRQPSAADSSAAHDASRGHDAGQGNSSNTNMDATPRVDGSAVDSDAATECLLQRGVCPTDCSRLLGNLYNRFRRCIENTYEVVGCVESRRGYLDDPRCVRRTSTGQLFRVPLEFIEPVDPENGDHPGDDWSACPPGDSKYVSSTVTPQCADLEDGGVYDGTP